jgi:predicted dehydrogenase
MVECARRTGKLLQIGHQRRSNPRYKHAIETLIREHKMLGRLTKATAQWNRSPADFFVSPEKFVLPQETLTKFGYQNMKELLNWRWFKKYGGGPMVDLGSHQIDLFIWAFGCAPSSIMAAGGNDYYTERELYDNVTALYEFRTPEGIARANYNVFTTTQHGGFYENFMGTEGTIVISEVTARGNIAEKEPNTFENGKRWDIAIEKGWIKAPAMALKAATTKNVSVDTRHSAPAGVYPLAMELDKPAHAPHLENFFDAIRLGVPLNCPPELAYESAVAVLKANEAVAAGRRLDFTHDEFKA